MSQLRKNHWKVEEVRVDSVLQVNVKSFFCVRPAQFSTLKKKKTTLALPHQVIHSLDVTVKHSIRSRTTLVLPRGLLQ